MRTAVALVAAVGALIMVLPAQAADTCFRISDMRNHTVGGDHTLYIDVGGRAVYRAEMSNSCLAGTMSSDPIVLHNQTGSPMICRPLDLDIGVHGSRCIVASLTKLTPAEVAALPKKMRP